MRLRVPHLVATASAVALSLGIAGGALAIPPAGAVDQKHECAATHCNAATTVGAYPVTAPFLLGSDPQNVSLGQTFTAAVTGSLTAVEVYVSTFDASVPASFDVRVESTAASKPSGSVLGTATVPTTGIVGQPVWVMVQFAAAIPITKNTVYAITLGPIASVSTNQEWLSWELDSSDVAAYTDYVGGGAFAFTAASGWDTGGSALFDGGSVATDFAFRTIVDPAAATPAPTATPTAPLPTQPPTDAALAQPSSAAGGGLATTLALIAAVGLVALVVIARTARRRR